MKKRKRQNPTKRELLGIIARLEQRIAELEAEVARLRKNSSTSSKPPSSDIVKPPKPPSSEGTVKRLTTYDTEEADAEGKQEEAAPTKPDFAVCSRVGGGGGLLTARLR